MAYRIEDFNISVKFNTKGHFTSNKFITDKELKKVFLFNFVTDQENISASCSRVEDDIDIRRYVDANLKNFIKLNARNFITKEKEDRFFVAFELKHNKVIQIYFIRKSILYCFSATVPSDRDITAKNLLTNATSRRMVNIIKTIKDLN